MKTKVELARIAESVKAAPRDIRTLLELTGLDPGKDFQKLDLRNVDFSGCDLSGINFTGSLIAGCRFTGARVSEAVFDASHAAYIDLFVDAFDRPAIPIFARRIVVAGEIFVEEEEIYGEVHLGAAGGAFRCAVALANLDNPTDFLGPIGADGNGDILQNELTDAGVDILLKERVNLPTPVQLSFKGKRPPNSRIENGATLSAPQLNLLPSLMNEQALLCISGFVVSEWIASEVWLPLAQAAVSNGMLLVLDIDLRDMTGFNEKIDLNKLRRLMDLSHIVKLAERDLYYLAPMMNPQEVAEELLESGNCNLVVFIHGDGDTSAFSRGAAVKMPPYRGWGFTQSVSTGSGFTAGILTALADRGTIEPSQLSELDSSGLREILRVGAMVAGHSMGKDYPGLRYRSPTRSELNAMLAQR